MTGGGGELPSRAACGAVKPAGCVGGGVPGCGALGRQGGRGKWTIYGYTIHEACNNPSNSDPGRCVHPLRFYKTAVMRSVFFQESYQVQLLVLV